MAVTRVESVVGLGAWLHEWYGTLNETKQLGSNTVLVQLSYGSHPSSWGSDSLSPGQDLGLLPASSGKDRTL